MRLSGLYVKLFAGFWLVLIAAIVLLFWWLRFEGSELQPAGREESRHLQRVAEFLAKRPPPATGEQIRRGPLAKRGAEIFLFDSRGGALQDTPPPPQLAAFVAETLSQPNPMRQARAGWMWVGPVAVHRPDQTVFAYLKLRLPPGRLEILHTLRKRPWLLLVSFFVLSGVLLAALGWHLSRPLRRLELASKALAEGDLAQRVGERITRRHDEIGALARRFNQMADSVSGSFQSQRRLLSDVSHELRSPLTRLQLATSLIRREQPEEPHLRRIQQEAGRLDEMIASLLALSRGQLQAVERTLVSIKDIVEDCLQDADFEAGNQQKRVLARQMQDAVLMVNQDQIASAISNLLGNALRHAQQNVWVSVNKTEPGWVTVSVEDDGPGVPASQLEAIFRPFHRVDEARERESGGAGLGLAIVTSAVSAHGGEVSAKNRDEGGLCVNVRLPCER